MKKLFFLIMLFFLFAPPGFCENTVLRGSVNYTVESARKLAFEGLDLKLDKKLLTPYIEDENNKENLELIKSHKQTAGRKVMSFVMAKGFVKGYAIIYDDKPEYIYYYSNGGYLVAVDIDKKFDSNTYPYKIGKYSALTGNLISIGFYVSEDEQYVYTKNGKLRAHWVGNTGYNEKGKPIATRDFSDNILENSF